MQFSVFLQVLVEWDGLELQALSTGIGNNYACTWYVSTT